MASVVYKPWSSVVADLTNLIGQTVTIRFTTYDCSLGGHFGYAYIDGSCLAFMKTSNDTICAGTQINYCVPNGFLTTTWNGPGVVNNTNQCINASAPGVYTCQTVLIPGCNGPNFTYTLSNFPKSILAFNPLSSSACSQQYTFANTSSISAGSISSYTWSFSNTSISHLTNPAYSYSTTGSYSINLRSTSDKGCLDTLSKTITIYPFPVANFTVPASCLTSTVPFTNVSSVSAGSISSYTWSFGNGTSSNLLNPSLTYSNSGNYLITLSATSNQSCVSTKTANLVIYPKPVVSFTSTSLNACSPQYSFVNTSTIASGSISAYTWKFDNTNSSSQTSPSYNFPSYGNYTVSLIASSNQGCKDSAYKPVTVYPFPTVSFTAPSTCLNTAVVFTNASSIPIGSINSYTWDFGDGHTSNSANASRSYSTSGAYLVSLSAISDENCVVTVTNNLTIYPMPNAIIQVNGFCYGNSSSFVNTSSISSGSLVSFGWNFGDGTGSIATGGNHAYASTGSYNVSFSVTSNQNCMSTAMSAITINPLPVLSFNVSNMCLGNITLFSNTSTITSGTISSYSWDFGNGTGSSLKNPSITYTATGNYLVSLSASSDQNCVTTTTSNVTIHPTPTVSFTASHVCLGDTTTFLNTSSINSGSIITFQWNFGDGGVSGTTVPSHNYVNYGNYLVSLSVTSDQNCTSSYTNNLSIYPLPVVSFSANNVCLGNSTNFSNGSSIPSDYISSWVWNFGNNQSSTQPNPAYVYAGTGTYTVALQAKSSRSCTSTGTKVVTVFANPTASFVTANSCLGIPSNFKNFSSMVGPDQIVSYTWDFGNGGSSTGIDPTYNYTLGATYSVKLKVTSNNNCSETYTLPIVIYQLPQVNFSPSYACQNQATQFLNSTTILSGSLATCRWDFENDGVWDDTLTVNPVKTYPTAGSFTCKLEVVSTFQCTGSKTNSVTVYTNPVADFSAKPVCLGNVTTFSNQSSSDNGPIKNFQWDFNGDGIIDNVSPNPTITYSANGTYLVKLEVQTQYGCTNVKSKSGRINATPVPNFVSNNNKACQGQPVNFENTSSIATGSIVITEWQFGDGSAPDYSQNPLHTYGAGSYNVTLKLVSDSGCIKTYTNPGFVTIYPKPVAGFNVNPEEVDENDPVINVSSSARNAAYTRYYLNDGSEYGTDRFNHTFANVDLVKPVVVQIVTNEFNCSDTSIRALTIKPAFVIYIPNTFTPNGDGLNDGFQAKGVGITKFSIQIYDRWGHLLYETNDIENSWDGTVRGSEEPIKQDTYAWKATVVDIFNKSHDLSGHVSLIR